MKERTRKQVEKMRDFLNADFYMDIDKIQAMYDALMKQGRISPTDMKSRGVYPYQEPERDEQGTFYGYKILLQAKRICSCPHCMVLVSPTYVREWINGCLQSDDEPREGSMHGIHCTKQYNHPELSKPSYRRYTHESYLVRS